MILIFQRTLAHYRLSIFREINRITGAILCFGRNGPKDTFLSKVLPDFKHCRIKDYYPIPRKDTFVIQDVLTPLFKFKPDIIVVEFTLGILSNWLLFLLRSILKYKLILWSHGYDRKKGFHPERYFADKLRLWWMNKADAVILYGQEGKKGIIPYLKNPEKIFVAQNTLDTRRLIEVRNQLERIGKDNVKKQIGFKEKYNLIYIGRLLKEKEPDRLISVFRIVSAQLNSIELHIVGDGPLLNQLKSISKGLKVKFLGSITDDNESGKLLFASDLMVMPGYLGLSVVHSFCFDTPVLSQQTGDKGPFHSPEIEYVINHKTGFLVEYGKNKEMAEIIIDYLLHNGKSEMKKNIKYIVENVCSLDNMLKGFKKAIDYVSKLDRERQKYAVTRNYSNL